MTGFATRNPLDKAATLIFELAQSKRENRLLDVYGQPWDPKGRKGPYPWQIEFHNAGARHMERGVLAANQVGKTSCGAAECAMHATGLYPPWFKGRRFDRPTKGIVAAETNLMLQQAPQTLLFGEVSSENEQRVVHGTGWIPKKCIGDYGFLQCGVPNVLSYVRVKHASGGWSEINFRTYDQGATKFQSTTNDYVWLDEEPEDFAIYSESLMRIIAKKGLIWMTRTPLFGASQVIRHFMDGGEGIWFKTVTWDDAPHLDENAKRALLASLPEHERDARAKGIPLLGSGAVYAVNPESYTIDPIPLAPHWARIAGCDFGIDHPAAGVWLAHDRDTDTVYAYDCYRQRGQTAAYHAAAIRDRGAWIPVAWPHDGMIRDKGGGEQLADQYRNAGANMLAESARYFNDKGGAQSREPITGALLERMKKGTFRVFRTCTPLLEELRMLHRDEGIIVPTMDDAESACRYALMSLRFALTPAEGDVNLQRPTRQARTNSAGVYERLRA